MSLQPLGSYGDSAPASEQSIVEQLVAEGYNVLQSELLVAFVPLGLGRAAIARLPVGAAALAPPQLLRLAAAPGFEEWYQALKSRT